jgi:hypothetical protein
MMKFGVHEVKVDVAPPQMGIKLILEMCYVSGGEGLQSPE